MAIRPKRKGTERKTETMNMRVDRKFAFAVWFASELKGQPQATFVERAVYSAIDEAKDPRGRSWKDYWDPSEGVRTIQLLRSGTFRTDAEEDRLLAFVREHSEFFEDDHGDLRRGNIDVLWPNIETFVAFWDETRAKDYWAAGKRMAEVLYQVNIEPPWWPPKSAQPGRPTPGDNDPDEQEF
jgi:hypothetical protein